MKVALFFIALAVLGGLEAISGYAAVAHSGPPKTVASTSHTPPHHLGPAKTGVKSAPAKFAGAPLASRGSLGGPLNKGASINGTGNRPKH